jgi:hypothetical protein
LREWLRQHGYIWGVLGGLALIPLVLSKTLLQPLPGGSEGPEAEALVKDIYKAVCLPCWEDTGAVYWVFSTAFRGNIQEYRELLWDRERGFVQVREGTTDVQFSLRTEQVLAYRNNMPVVNPAPLVERAYKAFMEDKYWLFPAATLSETGVTRKGAHYGDELALRVDYANRSFFPGDNYLWFVRVSGLPYGWKMWRADYPVKGLWMTFEKWITLETGAKVSTFHQGLGNTVSLEKTRGSYDFASLKYENDPFRLLELELGSD